MATNERPWWQRGIFYQVYQRSFQDFNGYGVGDLPRIDPAPALSEVARRGCDLVGCDHGRCFEAGRLCLLCWLS